MIFRNDTGKVEYLCMLMSGWQFAQKNSDGDFVGIQGDYVRLRTKSDLLLCTK